jgi:hypothetical protein
MYTSLGVMTRGTIIEVCKAFCLWNSYGRCINIVANILFLYWCLQ